MAGIYIHIPFCKHKCKYCNFYSVASLSKMKNLVIAVEKEIILRKDYCNNEPIETVYFGGGTPSLLSPDELDKLLLTVKNNFQINNDAEITLEINPDDVNIENAKAWKNIGFNRVSLGVQSFDDNMLLKLGRQHTASISHKSLETLIKTDFKNISADIIFGIPGLDNKTLVKSLKILIDYDIPHISAYALTVEPDTPLDIMIRKGKENAVDDNSSASQFILTMETLKDAGFVHYEISNYAKNGSYSIHNTNYWKNKIYLGIGPSAHSYNIISRQWNISNIEKYITAINSNHIPAEIEILSQSQKCNEYIMTSIRTIWGTNLENIKNNFGEDYYHIIYKNSIPYLKNGFLNMKNQMLYLSDKGKLFADKITSDLFV